MKITRLQLKNFKRFDDLTIDLTSLAEPAKLVLLIGTNGSGKSSVFDAFEFVNKQFIRGAFNIDEPYYKKDGSKDFDIILKDSDSTDIAHLNPTFKKKLNQNSFYGRTSIRQIPKLTRTTLGKGSTSFENDADRPQSFIERDNRFENDIEKVTLSILADVFERNTTTAQIKQSYIDPINASFENVFGKKSANGIQLVSFRPPSEGKTAEIIFEKGNSKIPYDYLSSGEKEIFNILINLLTRKQYFTDTVYFLDEIDLHLNTQLQKNLLKEITENWIPENCQLWTASHSLGFIEYANEAAHAAIIDFDNLNFDIPQVILPTPKNNFDVFEIAVSKEFLTNVFEGKRLFFSENKDTTLYNNLNLKNTVFLVGRDKADVFFKAKSNRQYNGLIDRDYLTDSERMDILKAYPNLFVLNYYSIENYLYHPANLEEYYNSKSLNFDRLLYEGSLRTEKKIIRDKILLGVLRARESYSFFRENNPNINRQEEQSILEMFDKEDFETYYKVFPAKDYGTKITERQNLNPISLAKTNWFKSKIDEVLSK